MSDEWKRNFVEHFKKQDSLDLVEVAGVDDLSWLVFEEDETVSLEPGILFGFHAFADDGVPMFIVAEAYALTQDCMLHLAELCRRHMLEVEVRNDTVPGRLAVIFSREAAKGRQAVA